AGKDWEDMPSAGVRTAAWSADGSILEFSIELSPEALKEGIFGFNIALADNDGGARETQLYPVNGFNDCYQGINLAELELVTK
ncbi:MAG: hypothetical protein JXB03_02205, partial [Spirochaetales bacterium]|nr:hypothetical protein [Spirochaetales bacterium]